MNNLHKLVAVDVDGTLLGAHGVLPEENIRVIRFLRDRGVRFVIATGRNDVQVLGIVRKLGIEPLIIGCNGASVRDLERDISYVYEYIGDESLRQLMKLAAGEGVSLRMFSLERYYHAFAPREQMDEKKEKQASTYAGLLLEEGNGVPVDSFEEFAKFRDKIIKAVVVNGDHEIILSIQQKAMSIPGLAAFRSSSNCLDIVNENASKGSALKILSEKLGIKREEVIAIGDGENDLPMLDFAGCAVAMGNGEEIIRKAADLVTETSTNAGVACALKKIFGL